MRVIVTRPQPQADAWVERLRAVDVDAVAVPLLAIGAAPDAAAVVAAWDALPAQALVMFVSPSAVERFFAHRPHGSRRWPPSTLAGSTGPGTAAALAAAGVPAACIVSPSTDAPRYDSETLWAILGARRDWYGCSAMIVRGEGGRDWLADRLREAGASVAFVEAYHRTAPALDAAQRQVLEAARGDPGAFAWYFSSSEAVGQLAVLAPGFDGSAALAFASHPRVAEAAQRLGFSAIAVVAPTPQALADALAEQTRPIQSRPS